MTVGLNPTHRGPEYQKTAMKTSSCQKFAMGILLATGLLAAVTPASGYAVSSFFDIFTELSAGPPYPPATNVQANISTSTQPLVPIASAALKVKNVNPVLSTRMVGSDSGGGGGGNPGVNSFFDVFLEGSFMPSSFFDIFLEMFGSVGQPLPIDGQPTIVWHTSSFFDVFFDLNVPGQGQQQVKLEVRVPEGQPVQFINPVITNTVVQSFFDVFLEVSPIGPVNPTLPLFRMVMSGSLGFAQPVALPGNITKFIQNPDPTVNGMDVLAGPTNVNGFATMLADDFICTQTGPISDIHIWGSWLNDLVDKRPTFWIGIWSDVPRSNNVPSHPGNLLWWQQFSPGQYRSSLFQTVGYESFYNPNPPARLMGADHQIWQYDFFPQDPFVQQGTPALPHTYWLSVVASNVPNKFFGWKTTRDHYNDFAVYAPALLAGTTFPPPLQPWQMLTNLQGKGRELSFKLTTSQRQQWACNKDFYWPTLSVYNVRVVLPGRWPISGHFDGGGAFPQFTGFGWDWDVDNNTVLDWSGAQAPGMGDTFHVGFEGPGVLPPFQGWGWWDPFMVNWLGWIPQVNIGWPPILLTTPVIGITNILPVPPGGPSYSNNVFISSLAIEYFTNAVPLASLNRLATRSPIRRDDGITIAQPLVAPGASVQVTIPQPPTEATFAVVIPEISPVTDGGVPQPAFASTDWAMIPMTALVPPSLPPAPVLLPPGIAGSEITLTWTAVPGSIYRVQATDSLSSATPWPDVEGDVIAGEGTASKTVPLSGARMFYRVEALLP